MDQHYCAGIIHREEAYCDRWIAEHTVNKRWCWTPVYTRAYKFETPKEAYEAFDAIGGGIASSWRKVVWIVT